MPRPEDKDGIILDFCCLQPDGAGPSHKGEGVLAHYLSRTLERQLDRAGGERPGIAILVRYEQHGPRGVDAVTQQLHVVELDVEPLVNAL
jgi:hypothetical protein